MKDKKITFEEYKKASEFARIRYKIGAYVQVLAFILLIGLYVYTYINIEEMKTNPLVYGANKLDVECICTSNIDKITKAFINESGIYPIKEDYGSYGSFEGIKKE
jgi:hypothetical protein